MTKVIASTDTAAGPDMSPRLNPRSRRLIRSYGLLALIAIAFLLMAMFVRTVDRTVPADEGLRPVTVGVRA